MTLQNKKKCPTVNKMAMPSAVSMRTAQSEPAAPSASTEPSSKEIRKPGRKGAGVDMIEPNDVNSSGDCGTAEFEV
jgi:hypothetical protein